MNIQISDNERAEMRLYYENELHSTLNKLRHISGMLEKLSGDTQVNIAVNTANLPSTSLPKISKLTTPERSVRKRKKKRGRKSIWGEFILKTLKSLDRPLSYKEIIESAKFTFHIHEKNTKALKAAINQSAFRLRTVHNKIESLGEKGKKERYLALSSWYDENGKIDPTYLSKIK